MGSLTGWLGCVSYTNDFYSCVILRKNLNYNNICISNRMNNRVVRLQDCLSAFCATENLEDRYECDKCKSLTHCQKTLRIMRLPEVIIIHSFCYCYYY